LTFLPTFCRFRPSPSHLSVANPVPARFRVKTPRTIHTDLRDRTQMRLFPVSSKVDRGTDVVLFLNVGGKDAVLVFF